MDPDGEYYGEMRGKEKGDHHRHRPEPEPSAPPVDQEYLLSATSLDPPEEEMAGLTTSDPVAPTYAIPSILDTNLDQLPVASAVPIVTDAVGASADTANSSAPNSSTGGKTTNKKTVSANKPEEGSLAELRLRRKEREREIAPSIMRGTNNAMVTRTEPQPPRKEWLKKQKKKERQQKEKEKKQKQHPALTSQAKKKTPVQTEQRDRFLRFDY